jgi:CubicO group peptidase (beta-lactamase class C family)
MGACNSKTAPTEDDAAKEFTDALQDEDALQGVFYERAKRHMVERAAMVYIATNTSNITGKKTAMTTAAFVGDEVDENALFQAASLSKAVSAAAILTLAERTGISINEDIHKYVTSFDWKEIEGGDVPVTLWELLFQTAGATVHGFDGYPLARRRHLPNSVEVVRGVKRITNSQPVKLTGKKGIFAYSGGGYMIVQVFAEDVSGLPFAELLQKLILGPLGMTKSCFTQPLDPNKIDSLHITPAKPN